MATAATSASIEASTPVSFDPFLATLAALPERVTSPPFNGRVLSLCGAAGDGAYDYAVCIPVNNEQERLPAALLALSCAAARVEARGLFIFVVNDTQDGSQCLIARWAEGFGVAHVLLDLDFDPAARNAPHARRLALDIGHACAPAAALLTTDADTHVGPDWIANNLAELARGATLVCGTIAFDRTELGLLPAHVLAISDAESAYFEASEALWQLWAGPDTDLLNIRVWGASLGIAPAVYAALGGLPTPSVGEDRALCAAVRRHGLPVVQMPAGDTVSSARQVARAAHGCGETLRQRALETNPLCDDMLLPVSSLRHLAGVWNGLGSTPDSAERFARYRENWGRSVPPMRHAAMLAQLELAQRELDLRVPRRAVA